MLKSASSKLRLSNIFLEIIVIALIVLWIYTSISKIFDFQNFKSQLGRSPFLDSLSGLIAYTLPPGELILSLLLVIRRTRKFALYVSFAVMLLFTGYIWIMLHYAYDLPCSCGGVLAAMTWEDHLLFNIGYTLLAMFGIFIIESPNSSSSNASTVLMHS